MPATTHCLSQRASTRRLSRLYARRHGCRRSCEKLQTLRRSQPSVRSTPPTVGVHRAATRGPCLILPTPCDMLLPILEKGQPQQQANAPPADGALELPTQPNDLPGRRSTTDSRRGDRLCPRSGPTAGVEEEGDGQTKCVAGKGRPPAQIHPPCAAAAEHASPRRLLSPARATATRGVD
jgi:hypothetical protein